MQPFKVKNILFPRKIVLKIRKYSNSLLYNIAYKIVCKLAINKGNIATTLLAAKMLYDSNVRLWENIIFSVSLRGELYNYSSSLSVNYTMAVKHLRFLRETCYKNICKLLIYKGNIATTLFSFY